MQMGQQTDTGDNMSQLTFVAGVCVGGGIKTEDNTNQQYLKPHTQLSLPLVGLPSIGTSCSAL